MRFTLSSTALAARLSALGRVINSKNSLPILGDFLFEVIDGKLRLTASDSEVVMQTMMGMAVLVPMVVMMVFVCHNVSMFLVPNFVLQNYEHSIIRHPHHCW